MASACHLVTLSLQYVLISRLQALPLVLLSGALLGCQQPRQLVAVGWRSG